MSANTTGLCEGYHSFIKDIFAGIVRRARRLDQIIWILLNQIRAHYTARATGAHYGEFLCLLTRQHPVQCGRTTPCCAHWCAAHDIAAGMLQPAACPLQPAAPGAVVLQLPCHASAGCPCSTAQSAAQDVRTLLCSGLSGEEVPHCAPTPARLTVQQASC